VRELGDKESSFDKEAWLEQQEPDMRARYQELFKQQGQVDEYLSDLQRERYELEQKYLKLCGARCSIRICRSKLSTSARACCAWQHSNRDLWTSSQRTSARRRVFVQHSLHMFDLPGVGCNGCSHSRMSRFLPRPCSHVACSIPDVLKLYAEPYGGRRIHANAHVNATPPRDAASLHRMTTMCCRLPPDNVN
jgi:hypothetical protein